MTRAQRGAAPSALDSALRWSDLIDLYPRRVGDLYTSPLDFEAINQDANVFGTSGQRLFLIPMPFTHRQTIDRLVCSIKSGAVGGAGSVIRMAVFPHDSAWGTVAPIVQASVAATASGDIAATISQVITPQMGWLAIGTTDTTGALIVTRGSAEPNGPGPFGTGSPGVDGEVCMRFDGVNLSSSIPSLNLNAYSAKVRVDFPLVWIRKA